MFIPLVQEFVYAIISFGPFSIFTRLNCRLPPNGAYAYDGYCYDNDFPSDPSKVIWRHK
ncbi:MAG TPA: hypothetical protein VG204_15445 [Terriglobia bacterium]|nr:hypothetical protein [Terriglobia bacterium]